MALVVVNPQGQLIPTAEPPSPTPADTPYFYETRSHPPGVFMPGGGINPNIIQMLAGVGAELDPRGAGGVLGRAAINYSQMTNNQRVAEENKKAYNEDREQIFDLMRAWGGLSPKGKAGLTKLEVKPDGQIGITGNTVDQPEIPPVNKATNPDAAAGPINQETIPVPNTERSNVQPSPEIGGTGRTITESGSRRMVIPQGPGAYLSDGPSSGVIGYAPDGTPIMATARRTAPLGPAMPREQLESIPVPDNPQSTVRQLRPGQRNIPKQAPTSGGEESIPNVTIPIEKRSPSNIPGATTPLGPPASSIPSRPVPKPVVPPIIPPYNPPQAPAPQLAQEPPPVQQAVSGGGSSAPADPTTLLPIPRRRSQTMFDLRDIIPF